jgi:hypothetical protein
MSVTNISDTGKNICTFLFVVTYGKNTAIARRGVMLAGNINLESKIHTSNNPALLIIFFILLFIYLFLVVALFFATCRTV